MFLLPFPNSWAQLPEQPIALSLNGGSNEFNEQ
ncbi:hypothetical protein BgramDRAFT_6602 [Paraburkholderia graminis C4D1M]|uniref:Uncharacterized protein n=1 Tax=Paraburkholderia graminis (strain ATCC 700544 / DSM 17151 / LMG 18924 / NCIMB 13744 / C4D1M) TaxID=396598 RepID=B1GB68_PARG4|nr:hypothetical protein BgramDRAFT_6602 [Paraburkholderia graminis C4D1M]